VNPDGGAARNAKVRALWDLSLDGFTTGTTVENGQVLT